MNRKHKYFWPALAIVVLLQVSTINVFAQAPAAGAPTGQPRPGGAGPGGAGPGGPGAGGARVSNLPAVIPLGEDTTHTLTKHFITATNVKKAPHVRGFIQRWLVLEPIKNNLRGNSAITEPYLKNAFTTQNFSQDYNAVPKAGQTVKIGTQDLKLGRLAAA